MWFKTEHKEDQHHDDKTPQSLNMLSIDYELKKGNGRNKKD